MQVISTGFEGLFEIVPNVFEDERGWFYELYKQTVFHEKGITHKFVQENQSFSRKNVVRGLHLQLAPHAQAKLVTVIKGKVLDVVVDLRPDSLTFLKVYYCVLEEKKHNMLMVPEGFAHGFAALEDTIFQYKCSDIYHKASETGIVWNDPKLNINWGIQEPIVSEKDKALPTLEEFLGKSVISQS
jgi:dTDP-4-dehydrorhamnose 3,5-epimerase